MRAALIRFARRIRDTRTGSILRRIYHTKLVYGLFSRFFKMYFGFSAVVGLEPRRAGDRGPAPEADQEQLRRRYRQSAVAGKEESFVLYRIIGNDLVPRHRKGQSRDNLRFILEHEPELPGCEKRFVLNRIVDAEEESAIIALLESHGKPYLRIPFSMDEYARQGWDLEGLPEPGYTLTTQYDELPDDFRARLFKRLYRYKNNYVINNNGARNAALEDGKGRAKWVLPWDGNCFVTALAWQELRAAVTDRPWFPYVIVPMARVAEHASLMEPGFRPTADQEPQILFRSDAGQAFDEQYYYGRRPKVELLWRLGVPGPWDQWAIEPWDLPYPDYCDEAGAWQQAGWVARLPSGNPHLETGAGSETRRLGVRTEAVTAFLQKLDGGLMARRLADRPNFFQLELESHETSDQLPDMWAEFQRSTARRARKASRRAARRAERLLLSHWQLPLLLDGRPKGSWEEESAQLLEWLLRDAGARAVRRRLTAAGTLYDLFTLFLMARLERYELLSRSLLPALDRLEMQDAVDNQKARQALEQLCEVCGQSRDDKPQGSVRAAHRNN